MGLLDKAQEAFDENMVFVNKDIEALETKIRTLKTLAGIDRGLWYSAQKEIMDIQTESVREPMLYQLNRIAIGADS